MITIRQATQDDVLDVFKMCIAMHQETQFKAFELNPLKMVNSISAWAGGAMLLVAEKVTETARELVGMMVASVFEPWYSQEKMAVEELLYVKPEYRGGRAAFMLVREFVTWAGRSGAKHIRAGASTGTGDAAEKLYRHFGFEYVGGNYFAHVDNRS